MSIFNRIAHHHTINEAVSLKLNNKMVSDKTISKMAKKISNLTDQYEKFNALKLSLDIVKNIKETQARVKLTTLLLKEINVLSPYPDNDNRIAHLTPVDKVGVLSKSKGRAVATWMRELPSTLETIKSKQPGLLSLPTVTSIKGFKGDVIIDGQTIFKNFASVEPGVLARGSAPHYTNDDSSQRMSNHAIIFLKSEGFNQVISLNSVELSQSEKNSLTKSGINYIHIKTDDFSSPDKSKLLQSVIAMKGKNTYVYCGYGAGRTGTLVTAWQILNNKGDLTESTIEEANQLAILKDIDEKHAVSNSIERLNIWHGSKKHI